MSDSERGTEQIPEFASREEEVKFWENVSLDKIDPSEVEEVEVPRGRRPLSATFAVRFDANTIQLIRQIAKERGLGPTQLVRAWVLERLRIERAAGVLTERASELGSSEDVELRKKVMNTIMTNLSDVIDQTVQEALQRVDQERAAFEVGGVLEVGEERAGVHPDSEADK